MRALLPVTRTVKQLWDEKLEERVAGRYEQLWLSRLKTREIDVERMMRMVSRFHSGQFCAKARLLLLREGMYGQEGRLDHPRVAGQELSARVRSHHISIEA